MTICETELFKITDTIWQSILNLPVTAVKALDADQTRDVVSASVVVSGVMDTEVVLRCDRELANRIASIMFGLQTEAVTPAEANDVVAELVNMIGGNTKALLSDASVLSTPSVWGNESTLKQAGRGKVLVAARMLSLGYQVSVVIYSAVGRPLSVV